MIEREKKSKSWYSRFLVPKKNRPRSIRSRRKKEIKEIKKKEKENPED
jgi:hypothetical protein